MTDVFSKEKRSELMSRIHQPTKLEEKVRRFLVESNVEHEMYPKVAGKPDIRVGSAYVFVDGCFWHCCPQHYRRPKSNLDFWIPHVEESNRKREERRKALPYKWVRIWEHDVKNGDFRGILEAVSNAQVD